MKAFVADVLTSTHLMCLFVTCLCVTLVSVCRRFQKPSAPTLQYVDTELNRYVISKATRLKSKLSPPLFLKNRHIQCLIGVIIHRHVQFRREYVNLNDGGVVALDWMNTSEKALPDSAPVLIVLSGISGTKTPVQFICKLASGRKYRVVVFNKRGHDNSVLTTSVLQTFGDPRDLRKCVEFIHRRYPIAKMAAVGYSAGCGLLSRYLGEYVGDTLITVTVFISSGFNLPHLCLSNISRFYERILVHCLRQSLIKPHKQMLQSVVDLEAVAKCSTLREFEYHVYCKMHNCRDVAELWTENNPMKKIHDIDVPVLCISSLDDPVCLSSNIPYDLFKRPGWMLATTDWGGHTSFLENWTLESWGDKCALDYIDAVLEFQQISK